MSGPFRNRRTSYRPRIAPLKARLRALERLEQLSNGTGGLRRINPGIIAHHQREPDLEELQQDSDHLVNLENSLQAEDFNTGNARFEQTDFDPSDTQGGSSMLDHCVSVTQVGDTELDKYELDKQHDGSILYMRTNWLPLQDRRHDRFEFSTKKRDTLLQLYARHHSLTRTWLLGMFASETANRLFN
ncbi:hypothetical protein PCASD_22477 [Puccinia coronata f. sp. avenae]|uniref:Uncharacterized protein n=1 Tax=Puccinia coronata f. sp. avenae TaxID=200324 RepID=A0A2N5S6C4_9BASI|nr:hypothetical protein PCASD_22477 [Puccinia coronata f. sp. avenae]